MRSNKINKATVDKVRLVLRMRKRSSDSSLSPEARKAIQALRDECRLTREKLDRPAI